MKLKYLVLSILILLVSCRNNITSSSFSSIDTSSYSVRKDIRLYSNSAAESFDALSRGEYQWCSFKSIRTGVTKTYYFLIKYSLLEVNDWDGSIYYHDYPIVVQHFNQKVAGYSDEGVVQTYTSYYYFENLSSTKGCYFSIDIQVGQTVYFRIKGVDYSSTRPIMVQVTDYPNPIVSTHSYTDNYIWVDSNQHRAFCECGSFVLQEHNVDLKTNICLLCGGNAG